MSDLHDPDGIPPYAQLALNSAAAAQAAAGRLPASPAHGLVAMLEQLLQVLHSADPAQARRSVGLLGRLVGADIELEARGDQLRERLGVLLAEADQQATRLQAHAAALGQAESELAAVVDRLDAAVNQGRLPLERPGASADPADHGATRARFERRLATLARATEAYRMSVLQLRLARTQEQELHERYTHLRDVLLPVWRQRVLAESASPPSQTTPFSGDPGAIERELAAMRERLR